MEPAKINQPQPPSGGTSSQSLSSSGGLSFFGDLIFLSVDIGDILTEKRECKKHITVIYKNGERLNKENDFTLHL